MDALVFVIIFLAVALGFFLGRRHASPSLPQANHSFVHNHYVEGLKHLLDEQPDAAIDALVTELEINQETLEMYFSLGALWRKRGEMERAIRVHQALLESSALTSPQRQQVQLELALDYTHSGVLDRGEVLLKELANNALPAISQSAGRELVLLYQEEREWEKAIAAVDELCRKADIPDMLFWRHLQAHYRCELAERALGTPDWNAPELLTKGITAATDFAQGLLTQAQRHSPDHARVLFIRALLALGQNDLTRARTILRRVHLDPDHSMLLVPLRLSVDGNDLANLWDDLHNFYRDSRDMAVLPFLADLVCRRDGEEQALNFLIQELCLHEGMEPVASLIAAMGQHPPQYDKIRPVLREMLPFQFNCHQCGFQGRQFYWSCPSCKAWL